MDNLKQFIDNYGSVVKENLSIDLPYQSKETGGIYLGSAPATISSVSQKMRYNRRIEVIIQLAVLRRQNGHQ